MPERTSYAQGTPCWVDLWTPDLDGALAFYGALFGWERHDATRPPGAGGGFEMLTLRGRLVTAIGRREDAAKPPVWTTYLAADDVDEVAAKAAEAGGEVLVGPRDVGDAGRMAQLRDTIGAVVGVWQARARVGTELVEEPGTLGWCELSTRDVEAAKAFYAAVLGMEPAPWEGGSGPYWTWEVDGRTVAGLMPMDEGWPADTPSHWAVCFATDKADATAARAAELGGSVRVQPFDIPDVGRVALLVDPDGAGFAVLEPTAYADE